MKIKMNAISSSTKLFRFGNPFKTEAVILNTDESLFSEIEKLPLFKYEKEANSYRLTYTMNKKQCIFGLGQSLGRINKRSHNYRMWNSDDPFHTEEKEALYGSHPFFIISDENEKIGVFIDFPTEFHIDAGFTQYDILSINIPSEDFDLYIFTGESELQIIREYLKLTGTPYMPPKWAFGFQQSRWSYPNEECVTDVADKMAASGIPCDAIYVDIDYMDNYKVFTVDEKKFSDFKEFTASMKKRGIRLIPIIDPGVRIEENYSVYEDGVKNNYFCKEADGKTDFTAAVWPGLVHFPDFLNDKVRTWWGQLYHFLWDAGIDGIWNDMNEPAIFYTPRKLEAAKKKIAERVINNSWDFFEVRDSLGSLANRGDDYAEMYHRPIFEENNVISHKKLHNLYGFNMTRATVDEFNKDFPEKRIFLLTRSSAAGAHRMAAIWMGDNQSWWNHLLLHVQMLVSLNTCGFFYTGADVCGFSGNVSNELATRWMQFAIFSPLFRNHAALGTRNQEPYNFDDKTTARMRHFIRMRYKLLPYMYTEFVHAVKTLTPLCTPTAFYDKSCQSLECQDEFFLGRSVLVAPVYQPNAQGRNVFLAGNRPYLYVKYCNNGLEDFNVVQAGNFYAEYSTDEVAFFIKENCGIVAGVLEDDGKTFNSVEIIAFVSGVATTSYYEDDGETNNYLSDDFFQIDFTIKKENNGTFNIQANTQGNRTPEIKNFNFVIVDENAKVTRQTFSL